MTPQHAFAVRAPVRPGELDALQKSLARIKCDANGNSAFPFAKLEEIHFSRFVLLDAEGDATGRAPSLVFTTDFDGPPADHLTRLATIAGENLATLFRHCEGFPGQGPPSAAGLIQYMSDRALPAQAYYVNTVGRPAKQVRREAELRKRIEAFLDRERSSGKLARKSAVAIHLAIQQFVRGETDLDWSLKAPDEPTRGWHLLRKLRVALAIVLGILVLPLLIVPLIVGALLLRFHETRDVPEDAPPSDAHLRKLRSDEDFHAHNQFSACGGVKPGLFRRITVSLVLRIVNFGLENLFVNSDLTGVKTIHFARWVVLDGYQRLLFCSNYDGGLESYMDDFIDKVAWGLNAVFSNGVGYPRTRWLVLEGAKNEMAFKDFIRRRQIPTQVWYSAYPTLTAINIRDNAKLRKGLFATLSEREAEEWLRLL